MSKKKKRLTPVQHRLTLKGSCKLCRFQTDKGCSISTNERTEEERKLGTCLYFIPGGDDAN